MSDTRLGGGGLKQGRESALAVGKTIGKFKAVIRLDAFHMDSPAGIPPEQLFQEIRGGIGGQLRVGGQEAQACKLVNSSVFGIGTAQGLRCSGGGPLSYLPRYAVRDRSSADRALACRPVSSLSMGIAPVSSSSGTVSPGGGCSRAAAAGATAPPYPGLDCGGACPGSDSVPPLCADWDGCGADQGCRASIPPGFPKVDVRPALIVRSAGTADAIFFAYFIRDCRYAMSCVILLLMKDLASSHTVGV